MTTVTLTDELSPAEFERRLQQILGFSQHLLSHRFEFSVDDLMREGYCHFLGDKMLFIIPCALVKHTRTVRGKGEITEQGGFF